MMAEEEKQVGQNQDLKDGITGTTIPQKTTDAILQQCDAILQRLAICEARCEYESANTL